MLTRHGAGNCVDIHELSEKDPNALMHGTIFKAPPCKRLFHAYGMNLDTEVGYFFKHKNGVELMPSGPKSSCGVELDSTATLPNQNFKVKSGVIYETKFTRHNMDDKAEILASGDGTVPYASLRYSKEWAGPTFKSEIFEIDQSEHREILADNRFHKVLLEYLSETLVCYVLEGRGLSLPGKAHSNPFVVASLQYPNSMSEPQKTQVFQRQPAPQFKEAFCFGVGKEHLGGLAAAGALSASCAAIGIQLQVFSSRTRPVHSECFGSVFVSLQDVLSSPTKAVQGWYTLVDSESGKTSASGGILRLHIELEDPGQSFRGNQEEAIAAAFDQNVDELAEMSLE